MSVYNGSSYLEETMESIVNQTFTDFEFIIIEDCSTDNSPEIIANYANKDKRIIIVKNEENIGLTKSLNKGLKLAKGDYIARQDADDVSLPSRLEKEVLLLENNPEIGLVSCSFDVIDSQGNRIGEHKRLKSNPDLVSWYLLFHNHIGGHSQVMFRKKLAIELGGYDENRRYSQDYELWSRLMLVSKIAILPDFLLKRRKHSESISVSKSSEQKNYSLTQSKHNIEQLIGKKISLEEAKHFRDFWFGHYRDKRFPEIKYIAEINSRLLEIYQVFIQKENIKSDFSRKLRILIGKQFHYWIQQPLTIEQSLVSKFKISYYAFTWHWSEKPVIWQILLIPVRWVILFLNTLLAVFKLILQPLYYKEKLATNK